MHRSQLSLLIYTDNKDYGGDCYGKFSSKNLWISSILAWFYSCLFPNNDETLHFVFHVVEYIFFSKTVIYWNLIKDKGKVCYYYWASTNTCTPFMSQFQYIFQNIVWSLFFSVDVGYAFNLRCYRTLYNIIILFSKLYFLREISFECLKSLWT